MNFSPRPRLQAQGRLPIYAKTLADLPHHMGSGLNAFGVLAINIAFGKGPNHGQNHWY